MTNRSLSLLLNLICQMLHLWPKESTVENTAYVQTYFYLILHYKSLVIKEDEGNFLPYDYLMKYG